MADSKDWSSSANDALHIRLRHADENVKDVQFQPAFTYPIFGDEETIFGYRGLKVRLDYTADTLKPSLNITSLQQYPQVGDTKPDDIEGALNPLLPSLRTSSRIASSVSAGANANWEPPGELMHQYEANGKTFGIWSATLTDARAKELLRDMQIFILFFIEGGTCIELDDPDWTMGRWRAFFIYSIGSSPTNPNSISYSFVGYSTAYTLFFLDKEGLDDSARNSLSQDNTPLIDDQTLQNKLPCRSRISQFVILPPYQSAGHGAHLYNTMIDHFLAQPTTREITVEDPNESFDDLRDYCDLLRLRATNPVFATLSIDTSVVMAGPKTQKLPTSSLLSPSLLFEIRKASKIAPRQFSRLVEMQLLSRIPLRHRQLARLTRKDKSTDLNDRAYYFWRLLVKQRLYKHNLDSLTQLELEERIEKLEETLMGLERDYIRILEGTERRAAKIAEAVVAGDKGRASANGSSSAPVANGNTAGKKKRRIVVDDDDDDDDEDEMGDDAANGARTPASTSSKRAKTDA